MIEDPLHNS